MHHLYCPRHPFQTRRQLQPPRARKPRRCRHLRRRPQQVVRAAGNATSTSPSRCRRRRAWPKRRRQRQQRVRCRSRPRRQRLARKSPLATRLSIRRPRRVPSRHAPSPRPSRRNEEPTRSSRRGRRRALLRRWSRPPRRRHRSRVPPLSGARTWRSPPMLRRSLHSWRTRTSLPRLRCLKRSHPRRPPPMPCQHHLSPLWRRSKLRP